MRKLKIGDEIFIYNIEGFGTQYYLTYGQSCTIIDIDNEYNTVRIKEFMMCELELSRFLTIDIVRKNKLLKIK